MLGAHLEAEQPADTSCPRDPQAGSDPGKTAERPWEGGGAEELLRLQQQVAGLHRQLQRQEARWSAALRHLQTQIDALKRQDRGPWGGRGDAAPRARGAGRTPAASLPLRTRSDTQVLTSTLGTTSALSADEDGTPKREGRESHRAPLRGRGLSPESAPSSQPARGEVERAHSGKTVTCEDADRAVSTGLRVRGAASARRGPRTEGKPAPPGGRTAATPPGRSLPTPSGRTPAGPAACSAPLTEDGPAAPDTDARPSPSEGPEGKCLTRAQTDGLAGPSPDPRPQVRCCAGARTRRTAHPGGLGVLRFPSKRTEKSHPDGAQETVFPDGTVRRLRDGREETVFPDGTSVSVERNGDRTLVFSNGQRDIHTAQFMRQEYPDGTVKTVYGSGLQETQLTSGRVRVGRAAGSIVLDRKRAVHRSRSEPRQGPVGKTSDALAAPDDGGPHRIPGHATRAEVVEEERPAFGVPGAQRR